MFSRLSSARAARHSVPQPWILALFLWLGSTPVLAASPSEAAERLDDFIREIPELGPGYAVVVVSAEDRLLTRTLGLRRVSGGLPLTPDTPLYIASQTKAYVGLLAAALDERGVLSLDDSLADHWPESGWPDGFTATDWTLRDLLTHQVPLKVGLITTLEAYVTRIDPEDYPRLVSEYGATRPTGFDYANIGYNLYTAILERATGKRWQRWLQEIILTPLDLGRTSARTSDFPLDELAWSHVWQGEERGWFEVRPKTDGMMQSAGGLVTSADDMARFLQYQLLAEAPAAGLTRAMFATAQSNLVATGMEDRRNPYELPCNGYALGWNLCEIEGHTVYIHGGSYTGSRSVMAFAPDLGVGIAAFSNSDNMTGWLTSRTVAMFFQFLLDDEDAERWRQARIEQYPVRVQRLLEHRQQRESEQRAEARWEDWRWKPSATDLDQYAGRWSSGEPYLEIRIERVDGRLVSRWGDIVQTLEPARPDLFAGQTAPFETLEAFRFRRDGDGAVTTLEWDGRAYRRAAD